MPKSTQANDALAVAPAAPIPDWSNVRGFQVLAAAGPESDASDADPNARAELGKELTARAARFSQSVDDSIVLASDGLIRWLGDPVARLIAGEELLKPRAVLLADEALSAEDREAVQARLGLWIKAHVSKVLGPLEALAEPGAAVVEPVRALASRIAQSLGVLERERVRQQVKTLDQSARSTLRKLGVRFGSMYIFVPALLKPGARTLCSQLWGLRRGEAGAERLLTFAAAGRTSFAAEAPLAADTYRVAGFRLCGDRVVRIDIVERLNDLIRAAIPDHLRQGGLPPSEASGFVVSPQMTSLTGCSGESFASILRSLGYESHRVKRSEFEAATRKPIASMNPIEAPAVTVAEVGDADSVAEDSAAETAPRYDAAAVSTESAEGDFVNPIEAVEPPPTPSAEPDLGEAAATASVQPAEMQEAPIVSETAPVEATETPAFEALDQSETVAVEVAEAGAEPPPPLSAEPEPERSRRGGADDVHPACRADRLGNGAGRGHRDAGHRVRRTRGNARRRGRRGGRGAAADGGRMDRGVAPCAASSPAARAAVNSNRAVRRGRSREAAPTSPGPTPPLAARRGAAPRGFRPRCCARRDAVVRRRRDARSGGERRTARSFPTRWRSATSSRARSRASAQGFSLRRGQGVGIGARREGRRQRFGQKRASSPACGYGFAVRQITRAQAPA